MLDSGLSKSRKTKLLRSKSFVDKTIVIVDGSKIVKSDPRMNSDLILKFNHKDFWQINMNKKFLYAQSFMNDSFKLAEKIHNSGYIPDVVIGIWRGGSIPAIESVVGAKSTKLKY